MAFSPDGKTLASGSGDGVLGGSNGTVRLWDMATQQQIAALTGYQNKVSSVAFSPDGKTLASGSWDGTVRLWDLATHQWTGNTLRSTNAVSSVAFSPDGKILASGSFDDTVRLWDVASGRQIGQPLTGPSALVDSVAFSPDGKTLASGSYDGTVRLWDAATHQQIGNPLTRHAGAVDSVAFSPDGKTLASVSNDATGGAARSEDGTVQLWDVATGRQIGNPLTGHAGEVLSVAFSPDGKTLASGNADQTVRLWNVATGRQIGQPLTGNTGFADEFVDAVAFSPDGKTLASGSYDGTVRLWDLATGRQIGNPLTGRGKVLSVAFSPDGKTLASGGDDDIARLWDVAYLPNTVQYLCASAGRSLTRAEWALYVPPGPAYQEVCRLNAQPGRSACQTHPHIRYEGDLRPSSSFGQPHNATSRASLIRSQSVQIGGYLRWSFRNSATLRHPPPISGLVPVTRGSPDPDGRRRRQLRRVSAGSPRSALGMRGRVLRDGRGGSARSGPR